MRTQTYSAVPVHENLKACPKRARVWMKIRRGYNGSVRLHFKFERSRRFMEENGNTLDIYNSQCMYAWLYVCMYVCMYIYICMYACMYVCIYMYVCMYYMHACIYVYIYIYIYI